MLWKNRAPIRCTHPRTVLGLVSAVCLTPVAAAPDMASELTVVSHDRGTRTTTGEICGLEGIEATIVFVERARSRIGRNGFTLFQNSGRTTTTWFNPETRLSVTRITRGAFEDKSITDNGGGVYTVRTQQTGIPKEIRYSDGTIAIKDVGRVVFEAIWWDRDTPGHIGDDRFIEGRVVSTSEPHPKAGSGLTLFCDAVVEGLT